MLGFMGIELTDLDKYDVVYVNNDEEHKYLDSYISKSEIGTRSLSSVLITEDKRVRVLVFPHTISITVR